MLFRLLLGLDFHLLRLRLVLRLDVRFGIHLVLLQHCLSFFLCFLGLVAAQLESLVWMTRFTRARLAE